MSNEVVMPSYPANLHYLTERLIGQFRNHFKIFPQSSQSVGANRKLVFTLPENSIVDLASCQLVINSAKTNASKATGGELCMGLIPQLQMFVQTCNVFVNGIQLDNSMPEWNTAYFLKTLTEGSLQKRTEVDDVQCARWSMSQAGGAGDVEGEARSGAICNWLGLIGGEASTRFLDTSLTGSVRIEILTSGNGVLGVTQDTFSPNKVIAANMETDKLNYTLDEFHFAVDTMDLSDGIYDAMLRQRMADQRELEVNYKSYYSLTNNVGTKTDDTTRWSVSSQSIDKVYATARGSDYFNIPKTGEQGVQCFDEPPLGQQANTQAATFTKYFVNPANDPAGLDQFCGKYQFFKNFNAITGGSTGAPTPASDTKGPDGTQYPLANLRLEAHRLQGSYSRP